jgi:DNA-binding beta-propeller fold protein YncE
MARHLTVLAAVVVSLVVVAVAGAVGELAQKPGTAGCISNSGTGGACQVGRGLYGAEGVAVSPEGNSVYVVSYQDDALTVFDRNTATGTLAQKPDTFGCISHTGVGDCHVGAGLDQLSDVAVSPDGKSVYLAAVESDAVSVFDRHPPSGIVLQKPSPDSCVSETGTGGVCRDGRGLDGANDVAVSPDGANVYVVSRNSDAIAIFDRAATGALTQKAGAGGCISFTGADGCASGIALNGPASVAVSPDGTSVYVGAATSNAVAIFDRAPSGTLTQKPGTAGCIGGGICQAGRHTSGEDVAVSPDGKSVYVAGGGGHAVAVLHRDAAGALSQDAGPSGCVSESGSSGTCADGMALMGAGAVAVSPDGTSVYVAARSSAAVAIFDRDPATGALTQKPGEAGCAAFGGGCGPGTALSMASGLTVSPDGLNLYVSAYFSDAIAIFDRALAVPPAPGPPPAPAPSPPPPAPPPPPAEDTVAPVVSSFAVVPGTFRRLSTSAPRGSSFRFRLSEPATPRILLERALPGRRVGRRCVRPTARLRRNRRCVRFVRVGTLSFRARPAGANRIAFRGRIGRRALKLGRYRATITATDAARNRSAPRRASFRVVRR